MEAENIQQDYFIISKEFSLKEDEEIEFHTYHDLAKKSNYILTIKDNKIYICLKLNHFGSIFYGNYVYEESNTLLIKEFDPLMLLINVFYFTTKKDDNQFSYLDLNTVVFKYIEALNNTPALDERDVESTQWVLKYLFDDRFKGTQDLTKICEKNTNDFTKSDFYRANIPIILTYLNKKLNVVDEENKRNCASILTSFLHDDITNEFLKFKNISLDIEDQSPSNNISNSHQNNPLKRKKSSDSSENLNKSANKKNKKANDANKNKNKKEIEDKSQKIISSFFAKKSK